MCYYNGIKVTKDEYIKLMELEKSLAEYADYLVPLQNGFDYGQALTVVSTGENDWTIKPMEWGFIPTEIKNASGYTFKRIRNREDVRRLRFGYKEDNGKFQPGITTLDARGEDMLLPNKIYRDAALNRRCLMLSSGFYEWRDVVQMGKLGKPLKTPAKYPYHITVKGMNYFYIAGIWQSWVDEETGECVDTMAMLTTEANPLMAQVHNGKNRMPVILPDDYAKEWLSRDLSEERIKELATYQFSATEMNAYTVDKDFRNLPDPAAPRLYLEVPELLDC
jgi:putative SOS response-associated peptidase YedK